MILRMWRAARALVPGFVMIFAAWGAGQWLTAALGLPIPSAMIGAVLLFATFLVLPRAARISGPACDLLLKYLPMFIFPLIAGFLNLPEMAGATYLKLVVVLSVSLLAAMLVAVWVFHGMRRDDL